MYTRLRDPTLLQLEEDVVILYPQLRGKKLNLMYLGEYCWRIYSEKNISNNRKYTSNV